MTSPDRSTPTTANHPVPTAGPVIYQHPPENVRIYNSSHSLKRILSFSLCTRDLRRPQPIETCAGPAGAATWAISHSHDALNTAEGSSSHGRAIDDVAEDQDSDEYESSSYVDSAERSEFNRCKNGSHLITITSFHSVLTSFFISVTNFFPLGSARSMSEITSSIAVWTEK